MAVDIIKELMDKFNEVKGNGEFHFDFTLQPSLKMKAVLALKSSNVLIIDTEPNAVQVSWVGSPSWYRSTTGKSSYNRDMVMQQAIPQIIEDCKVSKKSLRFLNPGYTMDLNEEESNGEKKWVCKNILTSINRLFPVVSKFK